MAKHGGRKNAARQERDEYKKWWVPPAMTRPAPGTKHSKKTVNGKRTWK